MSESKKKKIGFSNEELENTLLLFIPVNPIHSLVSLHKQINPLDYFSEELNLEPTPHISVCLKITHDMFWKAHTKQFFDDLKPFELMFDQLVVMQSKNQENQVRDILCLKMSQPSEAFLSLHTKACAVFDTYNPFPTYEPHITIAFLKEGKGKPYLKMSQFKPIQVEVKCLVLREFKDRSGKEIVFWFAQKE